MKKEPIAICWHCQNADTNGCSWSKELKPVEGWTALPSKNKKRVGGYKVIQCPLYKRDIEHDGEESY